MTMFGGPARLAGVTQLPVSTVLPLVTTSLPTVNPAPRRVPRTAGQQLVIGPTSMVEVVCSPMQATVIGGVAELVTVQALAPDVLPLVAPLAPAPAPLIAFASLPVTLAPLLRVPLVGPLEALPLVTASLSVAPLVVDPLVVDPLV